MFMSLSCTAYPFRRLLWEMTVSYLLLFPRPPTPPFPCPQLSIEVLQLSSYFSEEMDIFPFFVYYLYTVLNFYVLMVTLDSTFCMHRSSKIKINKPFIPILYIPWPLNMSISFIFLLTYHVIVDLYFKSISLFLKRFPMRCYFYSFVYSLFICITHIFTTFFALYLFLHLRPSLWYHVPSAFRTSFREGLLMTNY